MSTRKHFLQCFFTHNICPYRKTSWVEYGANALIIDVTHDAALRSCNWGTTKRSCNLEGIIRRNFSLSFQADFKSVDAIGPLACSSVSTIWKYWRQRSAQEPLYWGRLFDNFILHVKPWDAAIMFLPRGTSRVTGINSLGATTPRSRINKQWVWTIESLLLR